MKKILFIAIGFILFGCTDRHNKKTHLEDELPDAIMTIEETKEALKNTNNNNPNEKNKIWYLSIIKDNDIRITKDCDKDNSLSILDDKLIYNYGIYLCGNEIKYEGEYSIKENEDKAKILSYNSIDYEIINLTDNILSLKNGSKEYLYLKSKEKTEEELEGELEEKLKEELISQNNDNVTSSQWLLIYRLLGGGNSNSLKDCNKDDKINFLEDEVTFNVGKDKCNSEENKTYQYTISIENNKRILKVNNIIYEIHSLSDNYLELKYNDGTDITTDTYKKI